jgi:hypothetical protein
MTRDKIIALAKEAGLQPYYDAQSIAIEHFFAKAYEAGVAAEREACAHVCEAEARMHEHLDHNGRSRHLDDAAVARTCAAAIRARGSK